MASTAAQRWTVADMPDQSGRIALVTGANSGLGLESARALLAKGAQVVLACRTLAKAEQARRDLQAAEVTAGLDSMNTSSEDRIALLELDLADLGSVRRAAQQLAASHSRLDLLLNNAGVMAPPRTLTAQGFELQFGVNHLGHFALTQLLLPLLLASASARVVQVTSGAQYFGQLDFDDLQGERHYDRWKAYGQSKLANVVFAQELQRRHPQLLSAAAHPGLARTNLQPTSVAANGSKLERLAYRLMGPLFQSAAQGALPQLFALTAPEAQPGGHYGPSELGGMKGWPKAVPMAKAALDPAQGARLWQVSEELQLAQARR
ncbi:MAG: SDR family NAD(P)-dependent oxidoreductase [Cyanobacteria bacterium K_DeepCast_35m_m2_155]|nr:SDR family NAD(P)-dependent oxidoreductase [Cyanobacteria bacterium K_DeepCast_35m_m2_155]